MVLIPLSVSPPNCYPRAFLQNIFILHNFLTYTSVAQTVCPTAPCAYILPINFISCSRSRSMLLLGIFIIATSSPAPHLLQMFSTMIRVIFFLRHGFISLRPQLCLYFPHDFSVRHISPLRNRLHIKVCFAK